MKILNKLERKIGKYAIRNLSLYIICCFAIGYFLEALAPDIYYNLLLSPYHVIVEHQYWRLFTWIFTNPSQFSFFTLIMLFFYYSIGTQLERTWGAFMYNLYIFGGMFLSTVGVMGVSLFKLYIQDDLLSVATSGMYPSIFLTYYMTMSIFLAFAAIYADTTVLLYFIIPLKVKWIAYLNLGLLGYDFITNNNMFLRVTIIACILNFFIFYFVNKKKTVYRKTRTQKQFQRAFNQPNGRQALYNRTSAMGNMNRSDIDSSKQIPVNITRHKCAVCGRTERDSEELEFRFCSKCNGNYEYCNEHLFTHEHIK